MVLRAVAVGLAFGALMSILPLELFMFGPVGLAAALPFKYVDREHLVLQANCGSVQQIAAASRARFEHLGEAVLDRQVCFKSTGPSMASRSSGARTPSEDRAWVWGIDESLDVRLRETGP